MRIDCSALVRSASVVVVLVAAASAAPAGAQRHTLVHPPAAEVPVGRGSGTILLADVNADGRLDLLTRHLESRTIAVQLGNGRGGFAPAASNPLRLEYAPSDMRLGDLNGDHILDLAVTHSDRDVVEVLIGNGRGGFERGGGPPMVVSTPVDSLNKRTLQLVDLDEDGDLDVVTANGRRLNFFATLLGDGKGRFRRGPIVTLDSARDGYSFAFGDLDGDGHLDVVAASRARYGDTASGRLVLQRGNGRGSFTQAFGSPQQAPPDPAQITMADMNRDGRADLLISHGTNLLSFWLNGAGGRFTPAPGSPYRLTDRPYSLTAADLNSDGRLDLVAATVSSVTVLLGTDSGLAPAPGSPYSAGPGAYYLGVGDINGDGRPDVAAASFEGDSVTLLFGQ